MDITYYKQYEPIFGVWHITRQLGEGAYGKVFEMEREDFGVTYKAALKAITIPATQSELRSVRSEGMDEESVRTYFGELVRKLVQEFALMSKLKGNSNIVSYENHQVIEHKDGVGWDILIQMELLTPLDDYIRQKKALSRQEIIRLGIDLCKALELCQKYNIIHRDVKPENILVSENGDFKLGDFGVARTVEKTMSGLSKQGSFPYMAPEVEKGEAYGSTVDIYSLGLVLYRLLNGNRLPFLPPAPAPIKYADREDALAKRFNGVPLPPPSHADGRLAEIVLKACAFAPKDRYSSPAQMRQELEAILYNREEARYIYPEGDEVPQASLHNVPGEGTISDFGAPPPQEEDTGTISDFGEVPPKDGGAGPWVAPPWEPADFSFVIERVLATADGQRARATGLIQGNAVETGNTLYLLWPNGAAHHVTVEHIRREGGREIARAEVGEKVQLELTGLPAMGSTWPCPACGARVTLRDRAQTSATCPRCGAEVSFCQGAQNRPMGEPVAPGDLLAASLGEYIQMEPLLGGRFAVRRYDRGKELKRISWYENSELKLERLFYPGNGRIRLVADFDNRHCVQSVYTLEGNQLQQTHIFRNSGYRGCYQYEYSREGQLDRVRFLGSDGQAEWCGRIEYGNAKTGTQGSCMAGMVSVSYFDLQGQLLMRKYNTSALTEYRGRDGRLTTDVRETVLEPERIALLEEALDSLYEGLEKEMYRPPAESQAPPPSDFPEMTMDDFAAMFGRVPKAGGQVSSFAQALAQAKNIPELLQKAGPFLKNSGARWYAAPGGAWGGDAICHNLLHKIKEAPQGVAQQKILGVLRHNQSAAPLHNLIFLEDGLVTGWKRHTASLGKMLMGSYADLLYLPYAGMLRIEAVAPVKKGPLHTEPGYLQITTPGNIYRLYGQSWYDQDAVCKLLAALHDCAK